MKKLMAGVFAAVVAAVSFTSFAEDDWTGEPDCYVEYVQSSGKQYIDLGVKAASPIEADLEMAWNGAPGNSCCLGARTSNGNRCYLAYGWEGKWAIGYNNLWEFPCQDKPFVDTKYHVNTKLANGSQVLTVDDTEIYNYKTAGDLDFDMNISLFSASDTGLDRTAGAKCYLLKIWQGGELKRDLHPCMKNGEACLYDLVSHGYFRNKTATPLVAGPELSMTIDPIPDVVYDGTDHPYEPEVVVREPFGAVLGPDNYEVTYENNTTVGTATAIATGKGDWAGYVVRRDFRIDYDWTGLPDRFVEYVQATGQQYVDLGVRAASPIEADMEMAWNGNGNQCCLGAAKSSRCYLVYNFQGAWAFGYNGQFVTTYSVPPNIGTKYHVNAKLANGSQVVKVNDTEIYNETISGDMDLGMNVSLFSASDTVLDRVAYAKCYLLKIWQGGELKRDLHPCMKNGEACLYDLVSHGYFRNKTTTPLVAGPELSMTIDPIPDVVYDGTDHPYEPEVVVRDPFGAVLGPDNYEVTYENNTTVGTATAIATGKGDWAGYVVRRDFRIDYDWTGLPDRFVEYVQSSGKQYIDLGVRAASPIEADLEMAWNASPGNQCCLGARASNGDKCYLVYGYGRFWTIGYNGLFPDNPPQKVYPEAGTKYHVNAKFANGSQVVKADDVEVCNYTQTGDLSFAMNIFLFNACDDSDWTRSAGAKCYSLKIWQDGELKRDFYPCVKNGEACLYDSISKTYFRNPTDTPLTAGPRRPSPFGGLMLILR